jgi:hypothetical protein
VRQFGQEFDQDLLLPAWTKDVTGDTVSTAELKRRFLLGTALERERAARMKAAT